MPSTPARNRIRTRAMNRALGRLRDRYREEYEQLLAEEMKLAEEEAAADIARAKVEHEGEPPPPKRSPSTPGPAPGRQMPVPPSLTPGPRMADGSRRGVREDVARCPFCSRYHDRGHECPACRHAPPGAPGRVRAS